MRIVIGANNLAFDRASVRVKAGAQVTAVFNNIDDGVEHNLSFGAPGLAHGDTCKGPCSTTQTFTAPGPGRYFFLCTLHPMSGDFIVE